MKLINATLFRLTVIIINVFKREKKYRANGSVNLYIITNRKTVLTIKKFYLHNKIMINCYTNAIFVTKSYKISQLRKTFREIIQ